MLSGLTVTLRVIGAALVWLAALALVYVTALVVGLLRPDAAAPFIDSPAAEAALLGPSLAGLLAVMLYTRVVDRRPPRSLGLERQGAVGRWLRGAAIGALMMGFVVLVWFSLVDSASWTLNPDLARASLGVTAGLVAFLVQGPSEEILFRGYILQIVTARWGLRWGIGISSVLFAVLHVENASFGLLPFINLVLFGAAMGAYKLLLDQDQLWGVFAIHSVWNWLQQEVFGLENSGFSSAIANTLFHVEPNRSLPDPVWGGGFGPEGTLATTLVLLALLARVLIHARRRVSRDTSVQPATPGPRV